MKFEELNIDVNILRAVQKLGYTEPSPIQEKTIPAILEGRDVIGQAQTGTGKTAAFAIPLLNKIDPDNKKVQAIVLCPTRELAIQVTGEFRKLTTYMQGIKLLPVYGGQDIAQQIRSIRGAQIIVGTPGRIMDHMRRRTLKVEHIHTVILDEADEMLNMGFREDIETILKDTPETRQTVLFSATMPQAILEIAEKFQQDAEVIRIVKNELTVKKIKQYYYDVQPQNREEALAALLEFYKPSLSVVFCNTKRLVDELTASLQHRGYAAQGLHGDLKQFQRDKVMKAFRTGTATILVATDVAARGIDVENVDIVFNYQLPLDYEYYVHRIGRTGRAGKEGLALSFTSRKELYRIKELQSYCKTKIYARSLPDTFSETVREKPLRKKRASAPVRKKTGSHRRARKASPVCGG